MRVYLGLAMAVVLGLAGSLRAEPLNLEQVAANAKWVAHVDFDAMHGSSVAKDVREHFMKMHPKAEEHLAKIQEVWHFNPFHDLHGVTIYGADQEGHRRGDRPCQGRSRVVAGQGPEGAATP